MAPKSDPKSKSLELFGDYSQGVLQLLSQNEIIKNLPIAKTVLALPAFVGGLRDYILAKKLLRILNCINTDPGIDFDAIVSTFTASYTERVTVGERLIEICDKIDFEEKCDLVARAFCSYSSNKIKREDFERIVHAIIICPYFDLMEIPKFIEAGENNRITCDSGVYASYTSSGLAYTMSGWGGGGIHPTETANLISEFVLYSQANP